MISSINSSAAVVFVHIASWCFMDLPDRISSQKTAYLTDRRFSGRKCSTMRVSTSSETTLVSYISWTCMKYPHEQGQGDREPPWNSGLHSKVAPGLLRLNPRTKCRTIQFRGIPLPRVIGSLVVFVALPYSLFPRWSLFQFGIRNPPTLFSRQKGGGKRGVSRTVDLTHSNWIPGSHRHLGIIRHLIRPQRRGGCPYANIQLVGLSAHNVNVFFWGVQLVSDHRSSKIHRCRNK